MISFLAMKRWNSKKSLQTNENWSRKTKPTPPLQVMLDAKDQQTTQGTLSSRQLCKTAAAPRKVGILPWCFVAMKINRCKGSMPCMPKHPKPWGCRDLGPDFLVAVSLLSPNRTDSAVRQFLQTALALNKSSPVPCLEIWRFPDLGPGWVPRENGSIRSPSKESSESTSLGVE